MCRCFAVDPGATWWSHHPAVAEPAYDLALDSRNTRFGPDVRRLCEVISDTGFGPGRGGYSFSSVDKLGGGDVLCVCWHWSSQSISSGDDVSAVLAQIFVANIIF